MILFLFLFISLHRHANSQRREPAKASVCGGAGREQPHLVDVCVITRSTKPLPQPRSAPKNRTVLFTIMALLADFSSILHLPAPPWQEMQFNLWFQPHQVTLGCFCHLPFTRCPPCPAPRIHRQPVHPDLFGILNFSPGFGFKAVLGVENPVLTDHWCHQKILLLVDVGL